MDSETFGNRKNYSSHHSVLSTTPKWQFEDEIEEDHFLVRKHLYRVSMNSKSDSKPSFPLKRVSQLSLNDSKDLGGTEPYEINDNISNTSQPTLKSLFSFPSETSTKDSQRTDDTSTNRINASTQILTEPPTPHNSTKEENGHSHDKFTSKSFHRFSSSPNTTSTFSPLTNTPPSTQISGQEQHPTNSDLESPNYFDNRNKFLEKSSVDTSREYIESIKQRIKISANSSLKKSPHDEIHNKIQERIQWFRKQQATSNPSSDFTTTLQFSPRKNFDSQKSDTNKLSSVIKKPIHVPPPKKTSKAESSFYTEGSANLHNSHTNPSSNASPLISINKNLENSFQNGNQNNCDSKSSHAEAQSKLNMGVNNTSNNQENKFFFSNDQTANLESNGTNNSKNSLSTYISTNLSCKDNSPNNRQNHLENNLNENHELLKLDDKTNLSCLEESLTNIIALDGNTLSFDNLKPSNYESINNNEEPLSPLKEAKHIDGNEQNFEIETIRNSQSKAESTDGKSHIDCDNNIYSNNQLFESNENISLKSIETLNHLARNHQTNDFNRVEPIKTSPKNPSTPSSNNLTTNNTMNQTSISSCKDLSDISKNLNSNQQSNVRKDAYAYAYAFNGSLKTSYHNQGLSRNGVCKGSDSVYGSTMSGISSVSKSSSGEEKFAEMSTPESASSNLNDSFRRTQSMRVPRRLSSAQKAISATIENVKHMPNLNQKERKGLVLMLERKYQDTQAEEARESARREWEREKKIFEQYRSKKPPLPFDDISPQYRSSKGEYRLGPGLLEATLPFDNSMMDLEDGSVANQSTLDTTLNLLDKKRSELKNKTFQALERKRIVEKRLEETKKNSELRQKNLLEKQKRDVERALLTKKEKEVMDRERLARKNELAKQKSEKVKMEEKMKKEKLLEDQKMREALEKNFTINLKKKVKDKSKFRSSSDLNEVKQRQQEQEEQMRHWQQELMKYKQQQELKAQLKTKEINAKKKEKAAKMRAVKQQQQKDNFNRVMEKEEEWKEMVANSIHVKEARANKIQMERQKQAQRSKFLADLSRGLREELRLNQSLTDLSKLNDFIEMQNKYFE